MTRVPTSITSKKLRRLRQTRASRRRPTPLPNGPQTKETYPTDCEVEDPIVYRRRASARLWWVRAAQPYALQQTVEARPTHLSPRGASRDDSSGLREHLLGILPLEGV